MAMRHLPVVAAAAQATHHRLNARPVVAAQPASVVGGVASLGLVGGFAVFIWTLITSVLLIRTAND